MFVCLNTKHNLMREPYGSLMYRFGLPENGVFRGISYYSIGGSISEYMLSFIPLVYRYRFIPSVMLINRKEIPPHTDNGIITTINFYVETADAITRFYKRNTNSKTSKLSNQNDGSLFDESTLDYHSEFTAQPKDIYVLNVKEIHSVSCSLNEERFVYCLQTTSVPYHNVVEMLI